MSLWKDTFELVPQKQSNAWQGFGSQGTQMNVEPVSLIWPLKRLPTSGKQADSAHNSNLCPVLALLDSTGLLPQCLHCLYHICVWKALVTWAQQWPDCFNSHKSHFFTRLSSWSNTRYTGESSAGTLKLVLCELVQGWKLSHCLGFCVPECCNTQIILGNRQLMSVMLYWLKTAEDLVLHVQLQKENTEWSFRWD